MDKIKEWLNENKYLPSFMQNFKTQKDLFQLIHSQTKIDDISLIKNISPNAGHIYIIDVFLFFMARHGYTLQKSKANLPFDEIIDNINNFKEKKSKELDILLLNSLENDN